MLDVSDFFEELKLSGIVDKALSVDKPTYREANSGCTGVSQDDISQERFMAFSVALMSRLVLLLYYPKIIA